MTDWRTLVGCCSRLMKYAIRLTRNRADAEDLVQDTLEKAWVKREQCKSDPMPWMFRIMVNRYRDGFRSPYRTLFAEEVEGMQEPSIASSAEPYCVLADVVLAMEGMSPKLAEAFGLHRINGLEYEEIAQRLGVPIGTVKSRIARAQAELESVL